MLAKNINFLKSRRISEDKEITITHMDTQEESSCFQPIWEDVRREYYASKPIDIWVEIKLNGDTFSLTAQTPDAMEYHNSDTICFNQSIDENIHTDLLTENQLEQVTEFCQKIYDDYDYDVDAKIKEWELENER
jgi:hypothetical protein